MAEHSHKYFPTHQTKQSQIRGGNGETNRSIALALAHAA